MNSSEPEIHEEKITELIAAFYRRVREDDLISPMYPNDDWEGAEQRLRDFLVFRFGGSDRYIQERGHPRLRMRHAPFKIGIPERDRWLEIMEQAMEEVQIPKTQILNLRNFFTQVADFMRKQ
jgi:hemoglobin